MAGFRALAAVGLSIESLLNLRFLDEQVVEVGRPLKAILVNADDFANRNTPGSTIDRPAVSIYFYRLSVDHETRPAWSAVSAADGVPRIPLRMHFLLSAWGGGAQVEMEWLGLAARILERDCLLTGPMLDPLGEWRAGEGIQVVVDDLALDSMSEAFQALTTDYRLCIPYLARVVVLEAGPLPVDEPVATAAFGTRRTGPGVLRSGGVR